MSKHEVLLGDFKFQEKVKIMHIVSFLCFLLDYSRKEFIPHLPCLLPGNSERWEVIRRWNADFWKEYTATALCNVCIFLISVGHDIGNTCITRNVPVVPLPPVLPPPGAVAWPHSAKIGSQRINIKCRIFCLYGQVWNKLGEQSPSILASIVSNTFWSTSEVNISLKRRCNRWNYFKWTDEKVKKYISEVDY